MQAQQFSTQPQAVNRQKFRDDDEKNSTNIMHDRRVVRGNTYAALVIPEDDSAELGKQREAQRRRLKKANYTRHRPGTPDPVPGRHHMDVQTDTYLEELTERLAEFEAETQTDFLLDRPTTPLYIPSKSGVDRATQIEEGELFDFDTEVEAILEVLVGKTLERSMLEVVEEAELEGMRKHQEHFQQLREQELVEVQRMEASECRKQEEISRRKEQSSARKQLDDAVLRKILSRSISRSYLSGLGQRCFEELHDSGIFRDEYVNAVEGEFMPWLLESVKGIIGDMNKNERVVNHALRSAIDERNATHGKILSFYEDQIDEIEAAEQRCRDEKNEEKRLARLENQRIRDERERMERGEEEDWVTTRIVTDFADNTLTLDDESTDVVVPAELAEELSTRVATNAEAEEKIAIEVKVNMTKRLLVEILPAAAGAVPAEGAAEE